MKDERLHKHFQCVENFKIYFVTHTDVRGGKSVLVMEERGTGDSVLIWSESDELFYLNFFEINLAEEFKKIMERKKLLP